MRQDARARRALEAHTLKLLAGHALDAVVRREPLVDEGVIRREELEQAPVLAQHVFKKQLRLALHRCPQLRVERRKQLLVRLHDVEVAELEPLPGEVLHQRLAPRVFQHPPHLRLEVFPQLPALSQ